jgi:hypothetical protein
VELLLSFRGWVVFSHPALSAGRVAIMRCRRANILFVAPETDVHELDWANLAAILGEDRAAIAV